MPVCVQLGDLGLSHPYILGISITKLGGKLTTTGKRNCSAIYVSTALFYIVNYFDALLLDN